MMLIVLGIQALVVGFPSQVAAQPYDLDISSDSLSIDHAKDHASFTGNVVVVHDELTLEADNVEVLYSQAEGARQVDEVRAEGHVRILQGERVATSEEGVYHPAKNEVVLSRNVTLTQGTGQTMHGTKLHYDTKLGNVRLTAGSNRVRAKIGTKTETDK